MKRRKRFTIKLVALGLTVAALSAAPAQAIPDEGLYGQPSSTQSLVTADDIGRQTPPPSQPSVVVSDDGIELGSFAMSGIVLLLGAGAAFVAVHQARKGKLASA